MYYAFEQIRHQIALFARSSVSSICNDSSAAAHEHGSVHAGRHCRGAHADGGKRFACAGGVSRIYWTDAENGTIGRATTAGNGVEIVVEDQAKLNGIAVDLEGDTMYWFHDDDPSNSQSRDRFIRTSGLDGSGVENFFQVPNTPFDIALDLQRGKIYLSFSFDVLRTNLDGSDLETVSGSNARGIALDVENAKVYFTTRSTNEIRRHNFNGSETETLFSVDPGVEYIALDPENSKLYWTNRLTRKIRRADLDGSNIEDLVTGLSEPAGIALDLRLGRMFWADKGRGKIQRADLNGDNVQDLVTGLDAPTGIALALEELSVQTSGPIGPVSGLVGPGSSGDDEDDEDLPPPLIGPGPSFGDDDEEDTPVSPRRVGDISPISPGDISPIGGGGGSTGGSGSSDDSGTGESSGGGASSDDDQVVDSSSDDGESGAGSAGGSSGSGSSSGTGGTGTSSAGATGNAIFDPVANTLTIPVVEVPSLFGVQLFRVEMELTDPGTLTFRVSGATPVE